MLYRFLTEDDERILQAERSQLVTLRHPLAALDADSDDMAQLDRAILQLDELFLLVVVGEFNAGKSAFINALLGQHLLPEGVTPTTTQVTILRHGEEVDARRSDRDRRYGPVVPPDRMAARHQHRGHAGHERDHPPPPGDHRGVRAARRSDPLRHLGRPAVQRERTTLPPSHSRMGQEDRVRREQDRYPRNRRRCRSDRGVRRYQRPRVVGAQAGHLPHLCPAGAACQRDVRRRRAHACVGRQPLRAVGGLHPAHPR